MKKKYSPSQHNRFKILSCAALVISAIITLTACGGSDTHSSPTPASVPDISEIDPIPSEALELLHSVKTLSNGNLVVTKSEDSPNGIPAVGSVRIYNRATQINHK